MYYKCTTLNIMIINIHIAFYNCLFLHLLYFLLFISVIHISFKSVLNGLYVKYRYKTYDVDVPLIKEKKKLSLAVKY